MIKVGGGGGGGELHKCPTVNSKKKSKCGFCCAWIANPSIANRETSGKFTQRCYWSSSIDGQIYKASCKTKGFDKDIDRQ